MVQAMQQKALIVLATAALAVVWPAGAQTAAPVGTESCSKYTCPSGYKYRDDYEKQSCQRSPCSLYDRDFCCRKTGWPWWAWLLLALGIFYCLHACCCPACAIPVVGGLMGGKKKKKKKSKARGSSESDSSWSSDEYVVHPAVY